MGKKYTDKVLIEILKKSYLELGRSPKNKDFSKDKSKPHPCTYIEHFGSWNNALKIAGLKINIARGYTDEELKEFLLKKKKEIGRTPTKTDFERNHWNPCVDTYQERFDGSYVKALNYFGLQPYRKTKEERLAKRREWRQKSEVKEKEKEYIVQWRLNNEEHIKEYRREDWKNKRILENKRRKELGLPLVGDGFKKEMELYVYVSALFPNDTIIKRDRAVLNGLELDLYIPQKKLAFEYDGIQHFDRNKYYEYFHRGRSNDISFEKYVDNHNKKRELCKLLGITLIDIRYDEDLSEQLIIQKLNQHSILCNQVKLEVVAKI